jgi:hypothetical protein
MGRLSSLAAKAARKAAQAAKKRAAPQPAAPSLVVPRARPALPAPPKILALPAPGPGIPPLASKPRGGQFWVDKGFANQFNNSPEEAAREGALGMGIKTMQWTPDEDYGIVGGHDAFVDKITSKTPEQQWLERALTKYYKTDFGSPDDPLRSLAERGLHYDPEMTPEKWKATVDSYLGEDPIQHIMFPPNRAGGMPGAGSNFRGEAMAAMPWLGKLPSTENVYGIQGGGLDLEHFTDEFYNALNPEASGLPMDLAVRPESLDRMTFAQAAERVGRINQFRAKEMERAALGNLDSPAVQTFKEYAENNPMGLRWVELKAPELTDALDTDFDRQLIQTGDAEGNPFSVDVLNMSRGQRAKSALEDALKYEGDTMGHCVGGYCPDVMSGRSRIFSLRDAKGEPHVTIETRPGDQSEIYRQAIADLRDTEYWPAWIQNQQDQSRTGNFGSTRDLVNYMNEFRTSQGLEPVGMDIPNDIIQIKGKQNRAPKDDYLPFVQDFVKSQQWGNVGDLGNTGLVKLPDGRYITQQQFDSVIGDEGLDDRYQSYDFNARQFPRDPSRMDAEDWAQFQRHFEGFAIGGRVDADRCFCRHPMSVR